MSGDRLDVALLAAGLARSRSHARRIIEEGRARVDGREALYELKYTVSTHRWVLFRRIY